MHDIGTDRPVAVWLPRVSNIAQSFKWKGSQKVAEVIENVEGLQNPPIMNGIKYHVLFLNKEKVWENVVVAKRVMKIIATGLLEL